MAADPDPPVHALLLEIAPDAAHVATARLFAAAVARHFGADEERIHDVKLGVSEACTLAIHAGHPSEPVRISARPDGSMLTFAVRRNGVDPSPAGPHYPDDMGARLIQALFEGSTIDQAGGVVWITFSVQLKDAPPGDAAASRIDSE